MNSRRRRLKRKRVFSVEEYLASPLPTCASCSEPKADVCMRLDPFELEIHNTRHYIRVCDACVHAIAQEI